MPGSEVLNPGQTTPDADDRLERALKALQTHHLLGRPARFLRRRREQILYLVVGGWNTLFGYLVWALLQYLLHDYVYYLFILLLAWPPAVLNAYFCYRHFVFRSKGKVWRELPRFSLVYVVTLCLTLGALPILLQVLPFSIYVTQALFTCVVVICSYLSHKYFSFGVDRRRRMREPSGDGSPVSLDRATDMPSDEGIE